MIPVLRDTVVNIHNATGLPEDVIAVTIASLPGAIVGFAIKGTLAAAAIGFGAMALPLGAFAYAISRVGFQK